MATVYKGVGVKMARMVGDSRAMDEAADKVLAAVRSEAAKHRDTGDYMRSLKVEKVPGMKGVTDRVIYADTRAAVSIEFGHLSGRRGSEDRKWVPGKFIMINAAKQVTS
jgi:hypothetical protein